MPVNTDHHPPLDYTLDIEPDDDEPYNRCPACEQIIGGIIILVVVLAFIGAAATVRSLIG